MDVAPSSYLLAPPPHPPPTVPSPQAFLGRGFRDIEMLLEAGFRELEDQRSSFMANRRKKLRQRVERDRARRAQRTAGAGGALLPGKNGEDGNDADSPHHAEDGNDTDSDGSDGESLASFDSEALVGAAKGVVSLALLRPVALVCPPPPNPPNPLPCFGPPSGLDGL